MGGGGLASSLFPLSSDEIGLRKNGPHVRPRIFPVGVKRTEEELTAYPVVQREGGLGSLDVIVS